MKKQTYALITGASGGIGEQLALLAAADGYNVILVARDKVALKRVAELIEQRYGVTTLVLAQDLAQPKSPKLIFDSVKRQNISVSVLINNAGFGDYGEFSKSNRSIQLSMIDLNIRALTELTHLFLPEMVKRRKGYVVNLGSIASFLPGPLMSVYFASKAYVLSFSDALAQELKGSGVSVTCLCPGSTKTQFGNAAHVKTSHSTQTSRVTPKQVAVFGWEAMKKGKTRAIYGNSNRFTILAMKIVPHNLVARIVEKIQK
jgi:uncharacterized protein